MAPTDVTREDRELVATLVFGDAVAKHKSVQQWVLTGDTTTLIDSKRHCEEDAQLVAAYRLRAVAAFCEAHDLCEHGRENGCCLDCSMRGPRT